MRSIDARIFRREGRVVCAFDWVDRGWLEQLCAVRGVSGDESRVADLVWALGRPFIDVGHRDAMGNLILMRHWDRPGPRLVLCAHLDEVGLIITHIDDDGWLRFEPVGGMDLRLLPGVAVRVGAGGISGVIASPPIHLVPSTERDQALALDDLRIDIGASDRAAAERRVEVGDVVCFTRSPMDIGECFAGCALDDRAGIAAILGVLRATRDLALPVAAAFTVQEEIGTRGAAAVAAALQPDVAVVVETTTAADLPGVPAHRRVTRLGQGPAITIQDGGMIASGDLVRELVAAARMAEVPFQWKESVSGGTDGARFARAGGQSAVVSLPCRYLHAPMGLLYPEDLDQEVRLLVRWLEDRAAVWERAVNG